MKKEIKQEDYDIPLTTLIEVVRIKELNVQKKQMTYKDALELEREKGWDYWNYQIGFCSIRETSLWDYNKVKLLQTI